MQKIWGEKMYAILVSPLTNFWLSYVIFCTWVLFSTWVMRAIFNHKLIIYKYNKIRPLIIKRGKANNPFYYGRFARLKQKCFDNLRLCAETF